MKLAKENILSIAIAIMAMAVIAIILVSIRQSQQVKSTALLVVHTNEVLYHTEQVLNAALETEVASTHMHSGENKPVTDEHKRSAGFMYAEITRLKRLLADNPLQQLRCDSLLKYAELMVQKNGQAAAPDPTESRMYTTRIRSIIDDMQREETMLLQKREIQTDQAVQRLRSFLMGLIVVVFVLIVFIIQKVRLDAGNRKNAMAELRYRAMIMANISDAVITLDKDFRIVSWNRGAEKLYGYMADEAIGKYAADAIRAEVSDTQRQQIRGILKEKGEWTGALKQRSKDNEVLYIQSTVNTLKNNYNVITGYVVMNHDVTDRIRAEQHLKRFNKELEQQVRLKTAELTEIFERVTDAMVALDVNWHYTYINKKAGDIFGRDPASLIGKHIWSEFPEVADIPFYNALQQAMQQQQYVYFEEFHPFLERWLENHIYPSPRGLSIFFRDVTEQREASLQLQEQQADLRALVENTEDPVFSLNMDFHLLTFNSAFQQMILSLTGAEIKRGMNIFQQYPEVRKHRFFAVAERATRAERFAFEDEIMINDQITYYEVSVNPILNESKRQIGISFFYKDITQRKKADQALKESEEKYRTIYYKSPLPKWVYDFETLRFLDVNDAAIRNYGYSREEFLSMTIRDIRPQEDLQMLYEDIVSAKNNADLTYGSWKHIKKNGEIIQVEVTGHYIDYDNRKARMVIVNDITKRVEAEEKLARERNLLRVLINNLPDYIYVKDRTFKYIVVNRAIVELLGARSEDEVIGKNVRELFGEELATVNNEEDKRILEEGDTVINRDESVINHSGEQRWLLTTKVPLHDEHQQLIGLIGISRDITERRQTEIILEQLNEDLRKRANQLAASNSELEQFAYIASHDLQEPLRTTTGFVELLRRQYYGKMDETADKYLSFIADASDRMKTLIKDLLDYSRIGRKKELHKVDCSNVLHDVLEDLGSIIKENNAVIISDELPVITGYPTELKLLFQNLISNAIKFRRKGIDPIIHISVLKKNAYWEFGFRDNGIGIEPQHRERIFIIFQRLHTRVEYDGSGIGLAHCKKIVELHGGKIWITSTPGEGSTFHFTIYDMVR